MRLRMITLLLLLGLPAWASPLGFVTFGDWGMGTKGQKEVASGIGTYCATDACAFAVILGDNFYPDGVKSTKDPQWKEKFHDIYDFLNLTFYVSLGNHDMHQTSSPDAEVAYSKVSPRWVLPARYYDFTRGDVAFFAIDTNDFNSRQQAWLTSRLSASTARWKMVFGHHPIYSTGHHGDTKELVRDLLPLLKGKADFYLCGHDHDKEFMKEEGGVHFLLSGAGAETRKVTGGPRTLFRAETRGFAHLLVGKDSARVRFLGKGGKVEWETIVRKETPSR